MQLIFAPYLYQCPNPLCQCVFASQWGLSMHFYHQNNVFCNPPERLRTHAEVVFPFHLPEHSPPMSVHSKSSSGNTFPDADNNSLLCCSAGVHDQENSTEGNNGPPPGW